MSRGVPGLSGVSRGCPAVPPVSQEGLEEARRALAEARREKGMLRERLREQRELGMLRDPEMLRELGMLREPRMFCEPGMSREPGVLRQPGMIREPGMPPEQGMPPELSQDRQQEVRGAAPQIC